jgi:conjugal transfer ATP-binding protein TraC
MYRKDFEGRIEGQDIRELSNVMWYEDGLFLCDDKALGFAFECTPLVGGGDEAERGLKVLLNSGWPADTHVQFMLFASPDVQQPLSDMVAMREAKNPLFVEMTHKAHDFLVGAVDKPFDERSGLRLRDIKLIISAKLPIVEETPTDAEFVAVTDLRVQVEEQLKTIGFNPITLDEQRWLRLMTVIFNMNSDSLWRQSEPIDVDKTVPLREQFTEYPNYLDVDRDGLQIGDNVRVAAVSIKKWPKRSFFGVAAALIGDSYRGQSGIRHNFIISANVHFPADVEEKQRLDSRRRWIIQQAQGPMLKFVPALAEKKFDFDEMHKSLEDGDRPVKFNMTLLLFGKTEEELKQASANARLYWGTLRIGAMRDSFICLTLFLQALPFGLDKEAMEQTFRYKSMTTKHILPSLPVLCDWKGGNQPLLSMVSRNGQYMRISPYASSTNYNVVVAAESGAGKSVLANNAIEAGLACGADVYVIDVGRSYEKQATLYGGDFLCFAPDANICLNPFPLVREDSESGAEGEADFEDQQDMLVALLEAMAAPTQPLSDWQRAQLRRVLTEVWNEHKKETTIDLIAAKCIADEDPDHRLKDIGEQLYPFTSAGPYGKYFNGPNNIDFKKNFTVLELEELKGRKHLQQVVLLLLIWQIQAAMYLGDKGKMKFVLIDEAWDLLREGNVAAFIETGYRRARKYNGSMWTITQSLLDLTGPVGQAIVANSANMYLLRQKGTVIEKLRASKELDLGEGGYNWLKTVHTVPDYYSEILFMTSMGGGIGRLIVDPFRLMLYSTKPQQVAAIQAYRDQGYSVTDAINLVLGDKVNMKGVDARKIQRLLNMAGPIELQKIEELVAEKFSFEQAVSMVMSELEVSRAA